MKIMLYTFIISFMDAVYLIIIIIFWVIILFLTLGIALLLRKIFQKMYPYLKNIGNRLEMILFKKRREYIESLNIAECLKEDFCLPIDEVVTLAGIGTVVVGTVEKGMCREGEQAYLEQEDGRIDITLGRIDLETLRRKPDGRAYRTEHIAVLLIGVSEEQVKAGGKVIVENANLAKEV